MVETPARNDAPETSDGRERLKIGVLALQGDFIEHIHVLQKLDVDVLEVRKVAELDDLDGLIIPGGESTTFRKLMDLFGFTDALTRFARTGKALWGTCAGMIIIARDLTDAYPEPLGLMNIKVSRNWFGRQVDSFEEEFEFKGIEGGPFLAVFIRAPVVVEVGEGVDVIASLKDGHAIAVRSGAMMATAFHPELTQDTRVHEYFIEMAKDAARTRASR